MHLMSPRRLLQLRDGRFLSYHLAGWWPKAPDSSSDTAAAAAAPDAAATVIYHHGWPSSAAEVGAWHQAAAEQRVQVVAIDRPGVAASTFYLQGSFGSYAEDVSDLISHLGLHKVIHIGTSGGGPYACACAALLPHSTAALGLVASMTHCAGPGSSHLVQGMDCFNRIGFSCIAYAPLLTSLGLALAAPFVRVTAAAASAAVDATDRTAAGSVYSSGGGSQGGVQLAGIASVVGKAALWLAGATLPRPDRAALMQQPRKFLRILPAALADSFCQGSRGVFANMRSTTLPWDLNLSSIKAPTVVFQGDADVNVTVNMAQWLQQQIPGAELRLLPDEAHFSLVANHSADMLSELLSKVHRTT